MTSQLAKLHNSSIETTHSARNLGFIFDEHLSFFDQISALSKSCCSHIRELRCIRPYLDFKTANTIQPPPSFTPNLIIASHCSILQPTALIGRLQLIQNSLARTVVESPRSSHSTPGPVLN